MAEDKKAFVDQLKQALAKKTGTSSVMSQGKNDQVPGGKSPVRSNKPQKRAAGRGR